MEFEERAGWRRFGQGVGFIASYLLFTTILFTILLFSYPLAYWAVMLITISIAAIGFALEKWLRS